MDSTIYQTVRILNLAFSLFLVKLSENSLLTQTQMLDSNWLRPDRQTWECAFTE